MILENRTSHNRDVLTAMVLAAFATGASADGPNDAASSHLSRVIDMVCVDIHPSPRCERVFLLENPEEPGAAYANLIVLPHRLAPNPDQPLAMVTDIVASGPTLSMSPSLRVDPERRHLLLTEQSGPTTPSGSVELTIGAHEGEIALVAMAETTTDRYTSGSARCVINLVAGTYTATFQDSAGSEAEETGSTASGPIALDDWSQSPALPPACIDAQNAIFEE